MQRLTSLSLQGELQRAVARGMQMCEQPAHAAARELGNSGFVVHSLGVCAWAFAGAATPLDAIQRAIRVGGDTDTHAAIVGGWGGARFGVDALPQQLVSKIHDGPFGPTHLRGLGLALVEGFEAPGFSWPRALLRNVPLFVVVVGHGFKRLVV